MLLHSLTYLASQLTSQIDSGKYKDISIDDIKEHIDTGDLLSYLKEKLGSDIDLSMIAPNYDYGVPGEYVNGDKELNKYWIENQVKSTKYNEKACAELIDALQRRLHADGREGSWTEIVNNGLCYLLASIIGLINTGEWKDKRVKIVESYFDLTKLVDAWPELPESTRQVIMQEISE